MTFLRHQLGKASLRHRHPFLIRPQLVMQQTPEMATQTGPLYSLPGRPLQRGLFDFLKKKNVELFLKSKHF